MLEASLGPVGCLSALYTEWAEEACLTPILELREALTENDGRHFRRDKKWGKFIKSAKTVEGGERVENPLEVEQVRGE